MEETGRTGSYYNCKDIIGEQGKKIITKTGGEKTVGAPTGSQSVLLRCPRILFSPVLTFVLFFLHSFPPSHSGCLLSEARITLRCFLCQKGNEEQTGKHRVKRFSFFFVFQYIALYART